MASHASVSYSESEESDSSDIDDEKIIFWQDPRDETDSEEYSRWKKATLIFKIFLLKKLISLFNR